MGSNGIKSNSKHPYQIEKENRSSEPIEWKKVDKKWLARYGGKVANKKLNDKLKKDKV